MYIITELCTGGELFGECLWVIGVCWHILDLLMYAGKQNETEARRIFQQLVSAVAYCHSNGVVHRDLKAENILLGQGRKCQADRLRILQLSEAQCLVIDVVRVCSSFIFGQICFQTSKNSLPKIILI